MAIVKIFESEQWWREHLISSISKNMTLLFFISFTLVSKGFLIICTFMVDECSFWYLRFLGIEQWSLQLKVLHSSIDHKVVSHPNLKYDLLCSDVILNVQVYVKFSALFRVSRMSSPYLDLVPLLAEVVSNFGANRVMWGR